MYQKFMQAFAITASSTFLYKIILLLHQIALYSVVSQTLYGQQSSLFAALYVMIDLTNFGFNESLLPFFKHYTMNQAQAYQLIRSWYMHIIILAIIAAGVPLFIQAVWHTSFFDCNNNLIFLLVILLFIEGTKRTIVAIMHLAFLNKQVACAQLLSLISYVVLVWGWYSWQSKLYIIDIFTPFALTTSIELVYLLFHTAKFYQKLPQEPLPLHIPFKVLLIQRAYTYFNQIVKVVYNPNSMTLYFTYVLGFAQAAQIKFFTNVITIIYTCVARSAGMTTGAVLANLRGYEVVQVYRQITYRYLQLLALLSSIMFVVVSCAYYQGIITLLMARYIILFMIITLALHATVTYEQLLLVQGKAWVLSCVYGVLGGVWVLGVIGIKLGW